MSDSVARVLALAGLQYKQEHASGNYNDILNKPRLNNVTINGNHNSAYYKLPLLAETGHSISFSSDSEFNLTIDLLNKAGEVISSASLDLPLEEMVMDGRYEETSEDKWLVLTLQNGKEVKIPLDNIIDGLATVKYVDSLYEDLLNKLDSEANIREEQVIVLNARIDSEANIRQFVDDELLGMINSETEARKQADSELEHDLLEEVLNRAEADDFILDRLDSEVDLRDEQYLELTFMIDSEGNKREQQFKAFKALLDEETLNRIKGDSELRQDLNLEVFNRTQADLDLKAKLDSEASIRANKDTEIENLLGQEAATRSSQDIALSNRIDQKQDILSASSPLVKLGNTLQLNYDPNTLRVEDNALKVIGGGGGGTTAYLNGVLLDSEADSISAKIYWYGTEAEYAALDSEAKNDPNTLFLVESSEGRPISWTKSYYELEDKPAINGVTLSGDKSLASLGIQPTLIGTNPISVAGNQVSLRYNENQFFIGADNKLSFNDKDPSFDVSQMITFRAGFVGIVGGMNCVKFNNGLYVGNLKFMNEAEVPIGDITIGAAFGDDGRTFNGYCIGFDESNHVPITFEVINGELHMYNNNVIPSRRYITVPFTFVL